MSNKRLYLIVFISYNLKCIIIIINTIDNVTSYFILKVRRNAMLKICLTGGPGGGKTSAKEFLMVKLQEEGYKVLFCPETARDLLANGVIPKPDKNDNGPDMTKFQELILDMQLAKEELYEEIAQQYDQDKLIIFYDRGILDQLAYISKEEFDPMLIERNLMLADVYARYDAVFHLVTTADGAEKYYKWNNPDVPIEERDVDRSETPEQARIMDSNTRDAWVGHPHLRVFDNSTDNVGKLNNVLMEVKLLLGDPIPLEIERKYLIRKPDDKVLSKLGKMAITNIVQTYLVSSDDSVERRIRQRGNEQDGYTFYYTEKKKLDGIRRSENESIIPPEKYINYLEEADTSLHTVRKTRHCFLYKGKYFEMDFYPFSQEYAILEIELSSQEEEVKLPDMLEIVKEVTGDSEYSNKTLAKKQAF